MGLNDVRFFHRHDFADPLAQRLNDRELIEHGKLRERSARLGRAIEAQAVVLFDGRSVPSMLRARDVRRLPAELALLAQDRGAAEGVAALHRQGVIEDVENSRTHAVRPLYADASRLA